MSRGLNHKLMSILDTNNEQKLKPNKHSNLHTDIIKPYTSVYSSKEQKEDA